ncbi:MAG TPA: hypothetical protein VL017_02040 [Devosia sp.]|nr:hypothetical protein [Sphingomonadaceae bacterium]HTO27350.1 hypothetical protein [Devosia sp.]
MNALVSHRKDKRFRLDLKVQGAATITLDQKVHRPHRDDLTSLLRDWEKIGQDMEKAMSKAKRERTVA